MISSSDCTLTHVSGSASAGRFGRLQVPNVRNNLRPVRAMIISWSRSTLWYVDFGHGLLTYFAM